MSLEKDLAVRSGNKCELCSSVEYLNTYIIPPSTETNINNSIYVCKTCITQLENPELADINHWRCLNDSMWSQELPVQVVAYRMLNKLKMFDLLDMMYLDDETKAWAKQGIFDEQNTVIHKDSNGAILENGDNVILTQTLDVKGSSLSAKRGTAVKRIRLVPDNAEQIEGKIDGQTIVILTKYVKKQ